MVLESVDDGVVKLGSIVVKAGGAWAMSGSVVMYCRRNRSWSLPSITKKTGLDGRANNSSTSSLF